ncbi:MAG: hypothetical protein ACJ8R9_30955 [Steroidobacteraceae bacterium]
MNRRTTNDPMRRAFIVRIYRRTAKGLVGQVQDALTGWSGLSAAWSNSGPHWAVARSLHVAPHPHAAS